MDDRRALCSEGWRRHVYAMEQGAARTEDQEAVPGDMHPRRRVAFCLPEAKKEEVEQLPCNPGIVVLKSSEKITQQGLKARPAKCRERCWEALIWYLTHTHMRLQQLGGSASSSNGLLPFPNPTSIFVNVCTCIMQNSSK